MQNIAVQKTNNDRKSNWLHYGVTGALTGFGAKYALPLTEKEKERHNFDAYNKNAKSEVETELDNFVKAIKKDADNKNEASQIFADTFEKNNDPEKVFKSKAFKKANFEVQDDVRLLANQYNTLKNNGFENAKIKFDAITKASRSTNRFLAVGTISGIIVALANNALNENAKKFSQKNPQQLNIKA